MPFRSSWRQSWLLILGLLCVISPARGVEVQSKLEGVGPNEVIFSTRVEGVRELTLTLEPTWGLMLKQAVDPNGSPVTMRRLPYGDLFTLQPEARGWYRMKLVFSSTTVGALEVRLSDITLNWPGGEKTVLSPLSRMVLVEDPAEPTPATTKMMVHEHNAIAAEVRDLVTPPAPQLVQALPETLSGAVPTSESAALPGGLVPTGSGNSTLPPLMSAATLEPDFKFIPQARSSIPEVNSNTLIPILFNQKQGSKEYSEFSFELVFEKEKIKLNKPEGQTTYCRPNAAFYQLAKETEMEDGRLGISLKPLPGVGKIYGTAHQICGLNATYLGGGISEIKIEKFALDGTPAVAGQWEATKGGFGVALATVTTAAAPKSGLPDLGSGPREKLKAESDLVKADVVLGFNVSSLEMGLGDVQEIAVRMEKYPTTTRMSGASVVINFDHRYIKVVDQGGGETTEVKVNPEFEWMPTNRVNNFEGKIEVDMAMVSDLTENPKEIKVPVELFRFFIKGNAPQPTVTFRIDPTNVILPGLYSTNTVAVMPLNITVNNEKGKNRVAGGQGFRISGNKTITFGTSSFETKPERKLVTAPVQPKNDQLKNWDELGGYINGKVGTEVVIRNGVALKRGRSEPRVGGGYPNGGYDVTGGDYDVRYETVVVNNVTTVVPIIVWADPAALLQGFEKMEISYDSQSSTVDASSAFGTIGASLQQTTNLIFSGGFAGKVALDGEVFENPGLPATRKFNLTTEPAVFRFGDINTGIKGGTYGSFNRQGEGVEFSLRPGGMFKDKLTLDGIFMKGKSEPTSKTILGTLQASSGPFSFGVGEPIVPGSVVVTLNGELLSGDEYEIDYSKGTITLKGRTIISTDKLVLGYEKSTFLFFTGGITGMRVGYKPNSKINLGYSRLSSEANKSSAETKRIQSDPSLTICQAVGNQNACTTEVKTGQFKISQPFFDDSDYTEINITYKHSLSDAEIANYLSTSVITGTEANLLRNATTPITLTYGVGGDVIAANPTEKFKGILTISPQSLVGRVGNKGSIGISYPYFNPTFVQRLTQVIEGYRRDKDFRYVLPTNVYVGSEEIRLASDRKAEPVGTGGRNDYEIKTSGGETYIEFANNLEFPEGGTITMEFSVTPPDQSTGSSFDKVVDSFDFSFNPSQKLSIRGEYAKSTGDLGSISANVIDNIERFDSNCEYLRCPLSAVPSNSTTPIVQLIMKNGTPIPLSQYTLDSATGTIMLTRDGGINPYVGIPILENNLPTRFIVNHRIDETQCVPFLQAGSPFNYKCKLPFANIVNANGVVLREGEGNAVADIILQEVDPILGIFLVKRTQGLPMFADFQYAPLDLTLRVSYQSEAQGGQAGNIVTGGVLSLNTDYTGKNFKYSGSMIKKDKTFIEFTNNFQGAATNATNDERHALNITPMKNLTLGLNLHKTSNQPIAGNDTANKTTKFDLSYFKGRLKRFAYNYETVESETTLGTGGQASAVANTIRPRQSMAVELGLLKKDKLVLSFNRTSDEYQDKFDRSKNTGSSAQNLKATLALGTRGSFSFNKNTDNLGGGIGYNLKYLLNKSGKISFDSGYNKANNTITQTNKLYFLPQRNLRFDIGLDRSINNSLTGLSSRKDAYSVNLTKSKWGPFFNPKLTFTRDDNPLEQGGQRNESLNFDTAFTLLKTISITPRYTKSSTLTSTNETRREGNSLTATYNPKSKMLTKKNVTVSYSLNSSESSNMPKTIGTAPGSIATITSERSGTFNFKMNPTTKISTDFSYTFGDITDNIKLGWVYTHNSKLSVTGNLNMTEGSIQTVDSLGKLIYAKSKTRTNTINLKYRLTDLTNLDVIYDLKNNQGATAQSNYNGYSIKAILTANFQGI